MSQGILDDAGWVLPDVLNVLDLPDLTALGTDRPPLVCVLPNLHQACSTQYRRAWQSKLSEKRRPWFRPDEPLTSALLLSWLKQARSW